MKKSTPPALFGLLKLGIAFTVVCSVLSSAQAATVTYSASTYSNWSVPTNWGGGSLPTSSDTAVLSSTVGTGIYGVGLDTDATLSGIVFSTGTTATTSMGIYAGSYATATSSGLTAAPHTLYLGSGGIAISEGTTGSGNNMFIGTTTVTGSVPLTVVTTANQTWTTNGGANDGSLLMSANLAGSNTITWAGVNGGALQFSAGTSSAFTGNFILASGSVVLRDVGQLNRLGNNTATIQNAGPGVSISFRSLGTNATAYTFSTPLFFDGTNTATASTPGFNLFASTATLGSSVVITGTMSGTLPKGLQFTTNGMKATDMLYRVQGDGSGLTSILTGGPGTASSIYIHEGAVSVENNNAFGVGNSLSVSLGNSNKNGNNSGALYATNGIAYNGAIYTPANLGGTSKLSTSAYVGMLTAGTSTFAGPITVGSGVVGVSNSPNVHFGTVTGSKVIISGTVTDSAAISTQPGGVSVEGGGSVVMSGSNNGYKGGTVIRDGTTLFANGGGASATSSALGTGSVLVGYGAASVTGDAAIGSSVVTVSSTAGLAVGQSITGTGVAAGTVITFVGTNSIQLSAPATAAITAGSLNVAASTGVLAGNGHIRPGTTSISGATVATQNLISVASGSVVAPGDAAGTIGTLTLDGGGTTAPLLTMATGATFSFDLGTANTSDQLSFWNYANGDLTLNGNLVSVTNATAGTYTLFSFFSDNGTTAVTSDILSGLVLDTASLGGLTGTLNYNGTTITLNVVPEPATVTLIVCALGMAVTLRRRK